MNRIGVMACVSIALVACQTVPQGGSNHDAANVLPVVDSGTWDNHEQVWAAREAAVPIPVPHVVVTIEPTSQGDWTIWSIELDSVPAMNAQWAMQRGVAADGTSRLLPHRALVASPGSGKTFDAAQWAPLDGCALHATGAALGVNLAACVALVPGIGPGAALLPLNLASEGDIMRVRLYADQARGADADERLRKVHAFAGWAAINGAGPNAVTDSNDWHMSRDLKLGNEGGRAPILWRDGQTSGYSLLLERLTYREGNVPVLKLSIVEDASGRTLAYAWANPEATRIGINLGWVQVGLERQGSTPAK